MATPKPTPEAARPISAQDIVAILAGMSGKLDGLNARVEVLSTRVQTAINTGAAPTAPVTPTEASAILRAGRKGKAAPTTAGTVVLPAIPGFPAKVVTIPGNATSRPVGQVIAAPSKKAAKAERKAVQASNSAKYTCACGGWGVQDTFRDKHVAKGHTVTQLR